MVNTLMIHCPFTYLDRGFPLKSAISNALQNLMLSGISGMSAGKKKERETRVSTVDTGCSRWGSFFYEANHSKLVVITNRWFLAEKGKKETELDEIILSRTWSTCAITLIINLMSSCTFGAKS